MQELRERILNYIDREKRFVFRDYLELHDLEVEGRVDRGLCVAGGSCTAEGVFTYPENLSKFRSGEFVFVNEGHPIGEEIRSEGIKAVIRECHPERNAFVLQQDQRGGKGFNKLAGKKNLTMDSRNEDVLTRRLKQSVNAAFDNTDSTAQRIRSILEGSFKETPDGKQDGKTKRYLKDLQLLPKQEEAFLECFRRTFKLIQGPPGTGKTFLIAQIVNAFALSGKKVLVTAFTHRAINNGCL